MASHGVVNLEGTEPRKVVESHLVLFYQKKKSLAARRRLCFIEMLNRMAFFWIQMPWTISVLSTGPIIPY